MNNVIFISYRRDGGEFLGKMVYDELLRRGFKAFYDVESLRAGKFNEKILEVIADCDVFLMLLTPGSLDRCVNADDWVAKELRCAMQNDKRIVTLIARNFTFPSNLPHDLEELRDYQGVNITNEYFTAGMDKLVYLIEPRMTASSERYYQDTCSDLYNRSVYRFLESMSDSFFNRSTWESLKSLIEKAQSSCENSIEEDDACIGGKQDPDGEETSPIERCLAGFSPDEMRSLLPFVQAAADFDSVMPSTNPHENIKELVYFGARYRILDIFSLNGEQFAVCCKQNDGQHPVILIFSINPAGDALLLDRDADRFRDICDKYLTRFRLFELIPPRLDKTFETALKHAKGTYRDVLKMNRFHLYPTVKISRHQSFLGPSSLTVSPENTDGENYLLRKADKLAVLDAVCCEPNKLYLLAFPFSKHGKSNDQKPPLRCEPHVLSAPIRLSRKNHVYGHTPLFDYEIEECGWSIPLPVLDRFALRLEACETYREQIFE